MHHLSTYLGTFGFAHTLLRLFVGTFVFAFAAAALRGGVLGAVRLFLGRLRHGLPWGAART